MLVEFRLRNYRCFKDEQVLSLVANADDSLLQNLITDVPNFKGNLLRSVAIYGPNASGKTTILDALNAVKRMVTESASAKPDDLLAVEPFLLDPATRDAPTAFELTFIHEGVRYQYGFEIDAERVYQEYLYFVPRGRRATLFEREYDAETDQDGYYFGPSLKGPRQQVSEATRPNALFLSVGASLNLDALKEPYAWFRSGLGGIQAYRISSGYRLTLDERLHEPIKKVLELADLGIGDYRIEPPLEEAKRVVLVRVVLDEEEDAHREPARRIVMCHKAVNGEEVCIPLDRESKGTFQLFALSTFLLDALFGGTTLYVDELDASLHPELARAIIKLFHHSESNAKGAQLIFNTHDTTLMDNDLFRRDQIWFTEKDADGAAHLYSLLDFSPRRDASLAKGYLQGRYGALPFLGNPEMLLAEEGC